MMKKIHKDFEGFDAKAARKLADSIYSEDLYSILTDIKIMSRMGYTLLITHKNLKDETMNVLKEMGFLLVSRGKNGTEINWEGL